MVYLGKVGGPRTSYIIQHIGWHRLGISPMDLQSDIEWEEFSEAGGTVSPVLIDENGGPYYLFMGNRMVVYRFGHQELNLLSDNFEHSMEPLPKREYEVVHG